MNKKIKIGSRSSRLALVQVEEVFALLKKAGVSAEYEISTYTTAGDKDKTIPLTGNGQDDFFTDALDQALLDRKIDVAIHSAKDLPQDIREGLSVYALTETLDATDAFVGRGKLADLKPGAKVGTSSPLRRQGIKELNSQVEIVDIRGTIEERLKLFDEGKYDGIVVAVCALKRLGLEQRISEILLWESMALQGQLAVIGRSDNVALKQIFAAIDARQKYGHVALVGAGPGDPELITVKAIRAMQKADCVLYDFLIHKDLLHYAPYAEKIYTGKRKGAHSISQADLSRLLRNKAMSGKNVVRLKGGDPLIFGRGAEEIAYLRSYHIDVDVIPGISSATGIPSGLGIPLTARGFSSSVAFISGHGEDEENSAQHLLEIPRTDTVVFLMGLTKIGIIVRSLLKAGWKESVPMIVISRGTRVEERILAGNLGNIESLVAQANLEPPVLMVAGETVNFYRPVPRERILYLGTNPEKYMSLGQIIFHPMIEIAPAKVDLDIIKRVLSSLAQYQLILFTSRFGVIHFFELLKKQQIASEDLKNTDFAVIGESTAGTLAQYGFRAKVIAEEEHSEGMLEALRGAGNLRGKSILFPRSSLENPLLKQNLEKEGSRVLELTVYENSKPAKRPLPQTPIDKVFFTSPSTVKNFLEDYGRIPADWQILSRGPKTKQTLEKAGYQNQISIVGS